MSYTQATVPAGTDSDLARSHEPGEPAAATLVRAIVARLTSQVWVSAVSWETNGVTATARIRIAAAGAQVLVSLVWRAGTFALSIAGRRDPLRHSGLAHQVEHLATLVTGPAAVAGLAEQEVAERLAATIAVGGLHVARERTGADPALLAHMCAQCGDVDFDAAAGGVPQWKNHRCPVCRGAVELPAPGPATSAARPRRRRRPRPVQEHLVAAEDLPVTRAQQHHGPLADWPLHRLLQQITQERFTTWEGNLYEVTTDGHGNHQTHLAAVRDAELIGQLRRAGLVYIGLWLFADVDGQCRETHLLSLSHEGWKVLLRWTVLHATTTR